MLSARSRLHVRRRAHVRPRGARHLDCEMDQRIALVLRKQVARHVGLCDRLPLLCVLPIEPGKQITMFLSSASTRTHRVQRLVACYWNRRTDMGNPEVTSRFYSCPAFVLAVSAIGALQIAPSASEYHHAFRAALCVDQGLVRRYSLLRPSCLCVEQKQATRTARPRVVSSTPCC